MRQSCPKRFPVPAAVYLAASLAVLCGAASSAFAQNALGTGNALDSSFRKGDGKTNSAGRNQTNTYLNGGVNVNSSGGALDASLRQGDGGRNSYGRDLQSELAFRNAIVTGNAGAGLSFRGDVGYRASDDFRAVAGSDRIYGFERDTSYSGLATRNIRGLGSLQSQFDLTSGGMRGRGLIGDFVVNRASTGRSGATLNDAREYTDKSGAFSRINGLLRAPSVAAVRDSSRPDVLAQQNAGGPGDLEGDAGLKTLLIASGLQGVRRLGEFNPAFGYKPSDFAGDQNAQRAKDDAEQLQGVDPLKVGAAPKVDSFVSPFEVIQRQIESQAAPIDSRITDFKPALPPPENKSDKTAKPGDEPDASGVPGMPGDAKPEEAKDPSRPGGVMTFDERIERMRKSLAEPEQVREKIKSIVPTLSEAEKAIRDAEDAKNAKERKFQDEKSGSTGQPGPDEKLSITAQEAKNLFANPVIVNTLKPNRSSDEVLASHMAKGQEQLESGEYFSAEERFAAALTMNPGDPLAAVGRVHAQIGAGMYLSAALNLRTLLREDPELIAAKFNEKLVPQGKRLETIRSQLRARSERNTAIARDAGLLLAYLGQQTGNQQDVKDAFTIIDRVDASMGIEPDPLIAALRAAWLK